MKLYCIRHGETNYNRLGLCNDDPSRDVHISETGILQAEAAATQLRSVPILRIITSALPRTRETAEIINRHHGVSITSDAALNDIRSGFEGRPVSEYFEATGHDRLHLRVNGGESLLDYKARVTGFIEWFIRQPRELTLVVAHEETLRVFKAWFEGLPDEAMLGLHFGNCEIVELDLKGSDSLFIKS